jgi:hypothetical protein
MRLVTSEYRAVPGTTSSWSARLEPASGFMMAVVEKKSGSTAADGHHAVHSFNRSGCVANGAAG